MFVKVNSTRHTAAGTFRPGIIYNLTGNKKAQAAVAPHVEKGGPMEKLTKAQAEEAGTAVVLVSAPASAAEAELAAKAEAEGSAGKKKSAGKSGK